MSLNFDLNDETGFLVVKTLEKRPSEAAFPATAKVSIFDSTF
jgi:hypothetical protein